MPGSWRSSTRADWPARDVGPRTAWAFIAATASRCLDYQCGGCGRAFNAWTGTPLRGMQRRPSQLIPIPRGFAQGVSTARLARELACGRMKLLAFRHALQGNALIASDRSPLTDEVAEADELDRNAGEERPGS